MARVFELPWFPQAWPRGPVLFSRPRSIPSVVALMAVVVHDEPGGLNAHCACLRLKPLSRSTRDHVALIFPHAFVNVVLISSVTIVNDRFYTSLHPFGGGVEPLSYT